ncbi:MAG: hypothetical protein RLZZ306_1183 [Bacteroidota bacterium]|jgi:hypothetical protein
MKTKFAIIIYFTFILFTVIGTLSHEFGHFIVGRYLGSKTSIHYSSTSWGESELYDKIIKIYTENKDAIDAEKDFPQKRKFDILCAESYRNSFWFTFGGPFQTIFTGTTGVLLILFIRKRHQFATKLSHWICLFLALFWLRQPINLSSWILNKPINGSSSFSGDEILLARDLDLPNGSIIWVTGILGSIISGFVILKFVPKDKLLTFCISGFLGGISGIILWLKILGPIILP